MRRIALEEHVVLDKPAHIERWATLLANEPKSVLEKIVPTLTDFGEQRLRAMSQAGIDFAVLSSVGTVQGVLDATRALDIAREANDGLAEIVRSRPERYAAFATVPLQDPSAGADELERAVTQLGMKGTLLFGQTNGVYLDDERFDPFWERAQGLDVPVYLHAANALIQPVTYAGRPELLGPTWSWTAETAAHALRMIFGGVFTRFPKARLILGHMGEALPYLFWRLDKRAQAFGATEAIRPSEIMRKNVALTTAGVFSDTPLLAALTAMGEDAIMFSVDHPFESMTEASTWLDAAAVTEAVREKLSFANAVRILKLEESPSPLQQFASSSHN